MNAAHSPRIGGAIDDRLALDRNRRPLEHDDARVPAGGGRIKGDTLERQSMREPCWGRCAIHRNPQIHVRAKSGADLHSLRRGNDGRRPRDRAKQRAVRESRHDHRRLVRVEHLDAAQSHRRRREIRNVQLVGDERARITHRDRRRFRNAKLDRRRNLLRYGRARRRNECDDERSADGAHYSVHQGVLEMFGLLTRSTSGSGKHVCVP